MTTIPLARSTMTALALLAAAPLSRPASASTPGPCTAASALPADGATIPASVTSLQFVPSWVQLGERPPAAVEVRREGGAPQPVELVPMRIWAFPHNALEVRLRQPLEPGRTYEIAYRQHCLPRAMVDVAGQPVVQRFKTTAAAAWPTKLGTVRVAQTKRGHVSPDGETIEAHLEVEPSAELAPYLPVTTFSIAGDATGPDVQPGAMPSFPMKAWRACRLNPTGIATFSVKAAILGAPSQPAPVELEVELTCANAARPAPPPDAGAALPAIRPDAGDAGPAAPGPDGGAAAGEGGAPLAGRGGSGGCGVGRASSGGAPDAAPAAAIVAVALALVARGRRSARFARTGKGWPLSRTLSPCTEGTPDQAKPGPPCC